MSDKLTREEAESILQNGQDMLDDCDLWLGRVSTKLSPREEDLLVSQMEAWLNRNHPNPQARLAAILSLGIQLNGRSIQLAMNEMILMAQNTRESLDIRQACLDSWYEIIGIPSHRRLLKTIEEFFGE